MSLDIVVFFFRKRSFSTWIGEGEGDICFQFVASNWAIAGVHPRNKDIVFVVKVNIVGNKDKVDQWCWLSSKFSKFCKCRRFGNVDDEHLPFISFLTTLSRWHGESDLGWYEAIIRITLSIWWLTMVQWIWKISADYNWFIQKFDIFQLWEQRSALDRLYPPFTKGWVARCSRGFTGEGNLSLPTCFRKHEKIRRRKKTK